MTSRILLLFVILLGGCTAESDDPLPSWNEGTSRTAILDFVTRVTDPASADFVPAEERVAVFDNDGTLWTEQPAYFQVLFVIDKVKEMAPAHPEWRVKQPFKGILEDDLKAAFAEGVPAILAAALATHAGNTPEEFRQDVAAWLAEARHPRFDRPFTELVYQPMLELLDFLRAEGFATYIVSGGGIEFMRVWAEDVYGIPPEQVIGTSLATRFEMRDGVPTIVRLPEIGFVDDKEGKPVAINHHIGRRPILAFGNSDGDQQMLQWTAAGDGPRFMGLVHHTDAEREYAYDRTSHIGHLDAALDEAVEKGWSVVDMKRDWKVVFPPATQ